MDSTGPLVRKAVRIVDQEVEFIPYDGTNIKEIDTWMGSKHQTIPIKDPIMMARTGSKVIIQIKGVVGWIQIWPGDIVVKMAGDFYVYKEDKIFRERYKEI